MSLNRLTQVTALTIMTVLTAAAVPITISNTGAGVTPGNVDSKWILQPGPGNYPAYVVDPTSTDYPIPPWLANDDTSAWIAPRPVYYPGDNDTVGYWVFQTSFTLDPHLDPDSVVISGRWIADNWGVDIYVNGAIYSPTQLTPPNQFGTWTAFSLSGSGWFTSGTNYLQFIVRNQDSGPGGPTGLRVEFLSAQAQPLPEIPEPTTMVLLGGGLLGFGLFMRRRSST